METRTRIDRVSFDLFAAHILDGVRYEAGTIEITHQEAAKLEARGFGRIKRRGRPRRDATPAVPAKSED